MIETMQTDHHGMELLDQLTCVELLRTSRIGRVAVTHGALPVILPVAFCFLDNDLIFAVAPGVLAQAAMSAEVVCFEADWADDDFVNVWSVAVIGQLSTLAAEDLHRAQHIALLPWRTQSATIVKLSPSIFTGRRRQRTIE